MVIIQFCLLYLTANNWDWCLCRWKNRAEVPRIDSRKVRKGIPSLLLMLLLVCYYTYSWRYFIFNLMDMNVGVFTVT